MLRIDENLYLRIRALALALDRCLEMAEKDKSEYESALMISEMLVETIRKVDDKR